MGKNCSSNAMLSVLNGVYGSLVVLKFICLTLTGINLCYYNKTSDGYSHSKINSDELRDKNRRRAESRDSKLDLDGS